MRHSRSDRQESPILPLNLSALAAFSYLSTQSSTMQPTQSQQRIELPFESLMKLRMQLRRSRCRQNDLDRQSRSSSTQYR